VVANGGGVAAIPIEVVAQGCDGGELFGHVSKADRLLDPSWAEWRTAITLPNPAQRSASWQ